MYSLPPDSENFKHLSGNLSTPSVYQMKVQFHYCSKTMHLLHAVNVVSDTITTTAAFSFYGSTTVATAWCHVSLQELLLGAVSFT